ncbi:MAG: AraC family transcriptional regulator [Bacteroidota bacterium]
MLHLPLDLLRQPDRHPVLTTDGITVVQSCLYGEELHDAAYLSQLEYIYVHAGEIVLAAEGAGPIVIGPGQSIILGPDLCFGFRKRPDANGADYASTLLFLRRSWVREFLLCFPKLLAPAAAPQHAVWQKYRADAHLKSFAAALQPYFGGQAAPTELLRLKTQELLHHLLRLERGTLAVLLPTLAERKVGDLRAVMDRHFTQNWPLEEFARRSHRSLSTFRRDFQAAYGKPPGAWLRGKRLDTAAFLLSNGQAGPQAIAEEVGFRSYAHFSRCFKKRFGCSPTSFADRQRQVI